MYEEMTTEELREEIERMETILAQTKHRGLIEDCKMVIDICQRILAKQSQTKERA